MIKPLIGLLVTETLLCCLFLSPVKFVRTLAVSFLGIFKGSVGSIVVQTLFALLFVFFGSSLQDVYAMKSKIQRYEGTANHDHAMDERMLYEYELRSYLTGFCLLLILLLRELHQLSRDLQLRIVSGAALEKQATGMRAEYMRLLQAENAAKAGAKVAEPKLGPAGVKVPSVVPAEVEEELMTLKKLVKSLNQDREAALAAKAKAVEMEEVAKSREADAEKRAKAAEASVMAIRKQVDGQALEYARIMDECENLRAQVKAMDKQEWSRSSDKKVD